MEDGIREDILSEARRLLASAQTANLKARVLGGVAVSLHTSGGVHPPFARSYQDIDLVTTRKEGRHLGKLLVELGYEPNEQFNALNGARRLVFYDVHHDRQLDVFVGQFRMCHDIPIADRLQVDADTIPLAELLLTKLQIVHLNSKDLKDIYAILHEHDVAEHDDDSVNAAHIALLLSNDWGLWRTTQETIKIARSNLSSDEIASQDRQLIEGRLTQLWERIESEPKGLRWRTRAKVGERVQWYEEPEEVNRGPDVTQAEAST